MGVSRSAKTQLKASGAAPVFGCRAWVNFDGTGTVAIRASGNVSSITDNGIGDYTINFTNAMPDALFAVSTAVQTMAWSNTNENVRAPTTTSVSIRTANSASTYADFAYIHVVIFR